MAMQTDTIGLRQTWQQLEITSHPVHLLYQQHMKNQHQNGIQKFLVAVVNRIVTSPGVVAHQTYGNSLSFSQIYMESSCSVVETVWCDSIHLRAAVRVFCCFVFFP